MSEVACFGMRKGGKMENKHKWRKLGFVIYICVDQEDSCAFCI